MTLYVSKIHGMQSNFKTSKIRSSLGVFARIFSLKLHMKFKVSGGLGNRQKLQILYGICIIYIYMNIHLYHCTSHQVCTFRYSTFVHIYLIQIQSCDAQTSLMNTIIECRVYIFISLISSDDQPHTERIWSIDGGHAVIYQVIYKK